MIKEKLQPEFGDDPLYKEKLIAVWDKIIHLLMVNGTLVKVKGEVSFPQALLLDVVRYGLIVFNEPTNSKAKFDFKDAFNLLNYYILDDYNLKDMRKE